MMFYHYSNINVSKALVRPGKFPAKHFPDHHSEAVDVACVGRFLGIKNLNGKGNKRWARASLGAILHIREPHEGQHEAKRTPIYVLHVVTIGDVHRDTGYYGGSTAVFEGYHHF